MLRTVEFKGTVEKPNVDDKINAFLDDASEDGVQVLSVSYDSNIVSVKERSDAAEKQKIVVISSALILYDTTL